MKQKERETPNIKGLQAYIRGVHEHWVTKSNWNDDAMQTMNKWRKLGNHTSNEVGRFLLELTVASDNLGRKLTVPERVQLMKDKGINFKGNILEAQEVIKQVEGDLNRALTELHMLEKARLSKDYANIDTLRKAKIAELDKLFAQLRNRDYFPLSRFGKYSITMRAKKATQFKGQNYTKGEVARFELFENARLRNKELGKLRREYGSRFTAEPSEVKEDIAAYAGLPMAIFKSM